MSDVNILLELRHLFYLYRVKANRKKRSERARFWLDKALDIDAGSDLYPWVLAADGLHKVNEDRLADARKAFAQCRQLSGRGRSDDQQYVYAYSELWLAIGDKEVGYARIKELGIEAHSASKNASSFLRHLLPLSSMDKLEEVCGNREADDQPLFRSRRITRVATVDTNFDF